MLVLLQDTLEESMEVVIEDYEGEMTNEEFKDNLKELTELKIGSRTSFPFFPFHMQGDKPNDEILQMLENEPCISEPFVLGFFEKATPPAPLLPPLQKQQPLYFSVFSKGRRW